MVLTTIDDTSAANYLNKLRKDIVLSRNSGTALTANTNLYTITPTDSASTDDSESIIEQTVGDYEVTDNTGKLVAYLSFDYDVLDKSNSNNGTVTGVTTYVASETISSTHPLRTAFSFDGSSYITLANESNFDFEYDDPFSVCFWLKLSTIAADQGLVMKSNDMSTASGWKIYFNDSDNMIKFKLSDGTNTFSVSSTTALLANHWYHIACTYAGTSNQSGMKIYIDGDLEATGSSSSISSTILNNVSVVLGAESDAGNKMTGVMDELQVWNVALVAADIDLIHIGRQVNKNTSQTNPAYFGYADVT